MLDIKGLCTLAEFMRDHHILKLDCNEISLQMAPTGFADRTPVVAPVAVGDKDEVPPQKMGMGEMPSDEELLFFSVSMPPGIAPPIPLGPLDVPPPSEVG